MSPDHTVSCLSGRQVVFLSLFPFILPVPIRLLLAADRQAGYRQQPKTLNNKVRPLLSLPDLLLHFDL